MRSLAGSDVRHQKVGGFAALYVALAYVAAMPYFLLLVKYTGITDPVKKVAMLATHRGSMETMYLFTYVIFGLALAVLALTLYRRLKDDAPVLAQAAAVVGVIWALVLVAAGMIYNAGITAVVDLHGSSPAQAVTMWQAVEPVAQGLGGSGGELLGGLWVLLVSAAALQAKKLPRSLNWLGVVVGALGVLSVVPVLRDLAYGFGLLQIVWFVGLGAVLLRARPRRAGAGALAPAAAPVHAPISA